MSVTDINETEAMGEMAVSEVAAAMGRHAAMEPVVQERDLGTVTVEIKTLHRQAQQMVLSYAIEIGKRLTEAKALVEYGGWGTYIKEELGYSQSTANNFMRLFEEYGKSQQSLFGGEADSQTFGNLTYTQALALLALPAEEREEFVQAHDVEGMSTRELEAAIRERDEAKAALEAERGISAELRTWAKSEAEKATMAEDRASTLAQEVEDLKHRVIDVPVAEAGQEKIKEAVDAAVAAEREKAKGEADKLSAKLDKAKAERDEAKAALKEAQSQEGAAAAEADAEVEELRRQLAMADPVTAEFKGLFAQAGQLVGRMLELVEQAPEEKRPNLRQAMAALAEQMTEPGADQR